MQHKGIFITGSDTEVGKTYVGARLVNSLLQAGTDIQARKPVESGCELRGEGLIPADGNAYYDAMSQKISLGIITPLRFMAALAPPQAAALENRELKIAELASACHNKLEPKQACIVEGAGGFYSPLADDGLNADLAQQLNYPVLLVASNKLGCINHILLTLEAIKSRGLETLAIVLNQQSSEDASASSNASNISQLTDTPLISLEYDHDSLMQESEGFKELVKLAQQRLSV